MGGRAVTLFWAPGVPECDAAKAWLGDRGVTAWQRDVSSDAQALADLLLLTGLPTVPVLAVNDEIAVGFDATRFDEMFSAAADSPQELENDRDPDSADQPPDGEPGTHEP